MKSKIVEQNVLGATSEVKTLSSSQKGGGSSPEEEKSKHAEFLLPILPEKFFKHGKEEMNRVIFLREQRHCKCTGTMKPFWL